MTNREIFAENPDILTAEDLQKMLHVERKTVYTMLKKKAILSHLNKILFQQ